MAKRKTEEKAKQDPEQKDDGDIKVGVDPDAALMVRMESEHFASYKEAASEIIRRGVSDRAFNAALAINPELMREYGHTKERKGQKTEVTIPPEVPITGVTGTPGASTGGKVGEKGTTTTTEGQTGGSTLITEETKNPPRTDPPIVPPTPPVPPIPPTKEPPKEPPEEKYKPVFNKNHREQPADDPNFIPTIKRLYLEGKEASEIAEYTGYSNSNVRNYLDKLFDTKELVKRPKKQFSSRKRKDKKQPAQTAQATASTVKPVEIAQPGPEAQSVIVPPQKSSLDE
jgi:hypothetical protein